MPRDAFRAAADLAARVERPGARRVLRIAAAGACGTAPTVYLPGCNLACVHCWAGLDRDEPESHGAWMSYPALVTRLVRFKKHNRLGAAQDRIRLSGGEPILDDGFFELLTALLRNPGRIFIETNGVVLGSRPSWFERLAALGERVFFKVSIKAGTPEQFERITGAHRDAWESTWDCLIGLQSHGIPFDCNSLCLAGELFSSAEREALLARLGRIHPRLAEELEQEHLTGYPDTVRRMANTGWVTSEPGSSSADIAIAGPAGSVER